MTHPLIIIKDSKPKGRTRTSMDRDLQHSWGTSSFKSEEHRDKAEFLERKIKKQYGADDSRVTAKMINMLK